MTSSDETKVKAEELAVELVARLGSQFAPADDLDDSTRRWTTEEVAAAIYKHSGVMIPVEIIFEVLREFGYRYEVDSTTVTLKYVWLIKPKS